MDGVAGGGFTVCGSGRDWEGRHFIRLRRVGGKGSGFACLREEYQVGGFSFDGVGMLAGWGVWL